MAPHEKPTAVVQPAKSHRAQGRGKAREVSQPSPADSSPPTQPEPTAEPQKTNVDGLRLPSGFTASIRNMKGGDEDALSDDALMESGLFLDTVLASCITSLNGRPEVIDHKGKKTFPTTNDTLALCHEDRLFLLVKIRQLSYGDSVKFQAKCPACKRENHLEVSIENDVMPTYDELPEQREYTITLPSGTEILYGHVYGHQQVALIRKGNPSISELLAARVKRVGGKPGTVDAIKDLSAFDRVELRKKLNVKLGGLDTTIDITCSSCGNKFSVALERVAPFLYPAIS